VDSGAKRSTVFGTALRGCRVAAGLTQEELARRSGISVRAISDMERGRTTRPFMRSIRLLADAMTLTGTTRRQLIKAAHGGADDEALPGNDGRSADPPGGVRWPAVVPRQLPTAVRHFTGRKNELMTLHRLLDQDWPGSQSVVIAAIGGTAGVGKTTLAVRWGHQVAERFPDGQLWVNLRGFDPAATPLHPGEAIRTLLGALHVPPGQIPVSLDAQAGLYRSLLAGREILVVLDNARDTSQIRPLLPGAPGCLVVVTSRSTLLGLAATEGARLLDLDVLSAGEARQLLSNRLGAERLAAEPEAAAELIQLCAGLPLALGITAARASASPNLRLVDLAVQLRDTQTRLDLLDGGDPASSLRAVFCCSYRQLPPEAARMFRLLGVHSGPDISLPAASSLAARHPRQVHKILNRLTEAHLLTEHLPGRYTFHDLLHVYAQEQAEQGETRTSRRAALHRTLDHYLHTAHTAMLLVSGVPHPLGVAPPGPRVSPEEVTGVEQALTWFAVEKQVLLAAVPRANDSAFPGHAWRIAAAIGTFLNRSGHSQQSIDILSTALCAAKATDDHLGLAHIHIRLGRAHLGLRSFTDADAHLRQALREFAALDDVTGQGISHQYLSMAFDIQGDYRQALRHSRLALDMFREAGDERGEAGTLNAVGWLHMRLQDYVRGLNFCQEALGLNIKAGFLVAEAETWDSLGYAHHHLGQYAQALTCYQKALSLHRQVGRSYYVADTLVHIGDTHDAVGNLKSARDAWHKAFVILTDLQHPDAERVELKLKANQ
jgi:tetratricopeptide (TPR) repeat protein/transcriptional regulator with XRE-family HTH domain